MSQQSRDTKKLFDYIEKNIKIIQKQVLDLTEVSVPPENWRIMRSKILGITNDFRRHIEQEISLNYSVKYDPSVVYEDVVQVKVNLMDKKVRE